ncbi:protoheme IX farnesyltransferase, mitochondrial [[Candida] anglica]|uniref:Protoheme IX farnesyltransferase, mitochondrial n=1 Tax=[Candida] anglica TaxID=148631 RepID=A0ABP0EAD4_9ASCO
MISSRLAISRFNSAANFNFFFTNTKRKLVIEQNFIANQYLTLRYRRSVGPARSGECSDTLLQNVATKVLNCQDKDESSIPEMSASGTGDSKDATTNTTSQNSGPHDHVPFKVKQKIKAEKCTDLGSDQNRSDLKAMMAPYLKLTKPRLTMLVTLSSICSYALSPYTVALPELIFLLVGTSLSSGAANAINMAREPEFDKQMARTSTRPVVTGLVTPAQAYKFAAISGTLGCGLLYVGVNPVVATLGLLNIVLYSWIYTSLKRKHIINTWVGALVGAIPPLMGWAVSSPLTHPGAWCLAALLYAWQFPHFNALSHNIADQYKKAGYVMTAAENPKLNARVALRYSILMFPLCFGLTYFGVTDWVFPIDSAVTNAWMTYWAYKFWAQQRENYSGVKGHPTANGLNLANIYAKKLFWCSVWQLPVVLILAMLHKKGQWDRLLTYMGFSDHKTQYHQLE